MRDDRLTTIPDLSYFINPDGVWIDLEQNAGFGEVARITLHRIHLRLLLEETGHLLPPPPADELSKRLARQLCEVLSDLCDQSGLSPTVDRVIDQLIAYKQSLPDSVFPHDLYQNGETADAKHSDAAPPFELQSPKGNRHD